MELTEARIIELLKQQVKPANGCTEPIAVALAVAKAREMVKGGVLKKISIIVSPSIYKNGFSVTIPGTKRTGNSYAAALGYVGGKTSYGLQVLKDCSKEHHLEAEEILDLIDISFDENISGVYVKATVETIIDSGWSIIATNHDNIVCFGKGKPTIRQLESCLIPNEVTTEDDFTTINISELRCAVEKIEPEKLKFLLTGVKMNMDMAKIGIEQAPGLGVGRSVKELIESKVLGESIINKIRMQAAAATDARMGGINLPVMSSAGSGNHGITVVIPLKMIAEEYKISDSKLVTALAFAHLVTYYVKLFIGRLSPICGCAVAAGVGVTAGIAQLLGGDDQAISGAINSMIGNLAGMLCDGAKHDCALKIATSASEATISAIMAIKGIYMRQKNGIVGVTAEQSIRNMGNISLYGMAQTDTAVLKVLA